MLSAVQIFNNPLITFKTGSFIVLSMISWTYLLHAYYRSKKIEYRYFSMQGKRKRYFYNPDGTARYWDLSECLSNKYYPLDADTVNNLNFLIGLRNQIEHRKASGLDSYLSARYQACALNFNLYLKKFFGDKFGLDKSLALSLQFAELDYTQAQLIKNKEKLIPPEIISYVVGFDSRLSEDQVKSDRFAYRLLFTKVVAKRQGQADRVIEFVDPKSELSENISKEYWVKEETEKPKLLAGEVVSRVQNAGFKNFRVHEHTIFWKKHDGKNPSKGFGYNVAGKFWYWYENWVTYIITELKKGS